MPPVALERKSKALEVPLLLDLQVFARAGAKCRDRPPVAGPRVHGVVLLGVEDVHLSSMLEDPAKSSVPGTYPQRHVSCLIFHPEISSLEWSDGQGVVEVDVVQISMRIDLGILGDRE